MKASLARIFWELWWFTVLRGWFHEDLFEHPARIFGGAMAGRLSALRVGP